MARRSVKTTKRAAAGKPSARSGGAVTSHLPLRIVLVGPPANVRFGVQRGKTNMEDPDLLAPVRKTEDVLLFDLQVRVTVDGSGGPNFLGEFAQGPRDGRFVYVNSGVQAGEKERDRCSKHVSPACRVTAARRARRCACSTAAGVS